MEQRKRFVNPVRDINMERTSDFFENIKKNLLKEYEKKILQNFAVGKEMHVLIENIKRDESLSEEQNELKKSFLHQTIFKAIFIECVSSLDLLIKSALSEYQVEKLNIERSEMKYWQKPEKGIDTLLAINILPEAFKVKRSFIKNFRTLRHQFAHNPLGVFSFEDGSNDFEEFIENLEDVKIDKSFWADKGKKVGVFMPYILTSAKFLDKFKEESLLYYSMLLEILFPTETRKVFNFKNN